MEKSPRSMHTTWVAVNSWVAKGHRWSDTDDAAGRKSVADNHGSAGGEGTSTNKSAVEGCRLTGTKL